MTDIEPMTLTQITLKRRYTRANHRVDAMHVHIVFVTKYRLRVLKPEMYSDLKQLFTTLCKDVGAALVDANGETDHVHVLVRYPPTLSIPDLVHRLKRHSSLLLLARYPQIRAAYIRLQKWHEKKTTGEVTKTDRLWSPSYFAESYGHSTSGSLENYVRNQDTPQHKAKRKNRDVARVQ